MGMAWGAQLAALRGDRLQPLLPPRPEDQFAPLFQNRAAASALAAPIPEDAPVMMITFAAAVAPVGMVLPCLAPPPPRYPPHGQPPPD